MLCIDLEYTGYGNGGNVLHNIKTHIPQGGKLVILGESGSGKSTLIKTICGINKCFSGELSYNGKTVNNTSIRIGYMPQKSSLLPWLTVFENVIALKKAKDKSVNKEKVETLLNDLKIWELRDKRPKEISGGEQQRAALAGIIIFEPEILLMDEPFSALDEVTRESIQTLFCSLQKIHLFTTLFVTHNVEEALLIANKIIVLSKKSKTIYHTIETLNLTPWSADFYNLANLLREVIKDAQS